MLTFLVLFPLIAGGLTFILPENRLRVFVLLLVSIVHSGMVMTFWSALPMSVLNGFLSIDTLGLIVLSIVSLLFLAVSFYLIGYFRDEQNSPPRIFVGCLLLFLASMTLVTVTRHLGLFWVAIEATTLSSALLINFPKTRSSIEATWKYLMICSVGIALALLGTYFLAISATEIKTLHLDQLLNNSSRLLLPWLKISAIFLLVGYGTKMGLAPMHTWLPDTYSEAPSPLAALFSGAFSSCAFLGILRVYQICNAAGELQFFSTILTLVGIISLGTAAFFILGQSDYKRMLAYSSIEHMGILILGISLGAGGIYGSMFHLINNALSKGLMFLVFDKLHQKYHSRQIKDVQGVLRSYPFLGTLMLAGFFAVAGIPPFAGFWSQLMILNASIVGRHYVVAFIYIASLALIFIGMTAIVLKMAQGLPAAKLAGKPVETEDWCTMIPILFLALILLTLGLNVPSFLNTVLQKSALLLGGS